MYLGVQVAAATTFDCFLLFPDCLPESVGRNFDEEVLNRKDSFASTLDTSNEIVSFSVYIAICKINKVPCIANPGNPYLV